MHSKKPRTRNNGREVVSTSTWLAREKCYYSTGNITHPNALIFHVVFLGGMTGQRQDKISTQTNIWFSHNNPAITGPKSELKKLPPYGPFLNIMEQAISALKAAFTADISYPEQI